MSLPTAKQFEDLSGKIVEHGKVIKEKWYTYKGMLQALEQSKGDIVSAAVGSATKEVLTLATGVTTGVTLIPFAAVLTPWIGAAQVATQAGTIFELHDLKEFAVKPGEANGNKYFCMCGKCADNIQYVVDKKERNVGRIGIAVGTLGVSTIFTKAYSIGKFVKSYAKGEERPKERTCRGLLEAARGGCTVAMATVFLLAGNWQFMRGGEAGTMRRAIAMITSEDGHKVLMGEW